MLEHAGLPFGSGPQGVSAGRAALSPRGLGSGHRAYRRATELDPTARTSTVASPRDGASPSTTAWATPSLCRLGRSTTACRRARACSSAPSRSDPAAILTIGSPPCGAASGVNGTSWKPRSGKYPADAEAWYLLAESRYHHSLGPRLAARPAVLVSTEAWALRISPVRPS